MWKLDIYCTPVKWWLLRKYRVYNIWIRICRTWFEWEKWLRTLFAYCSLWTIERILCKYHVWYVDPAALPCVSQRGLSIRCPCSKPILLFTCFIVCFSAWWCRVWCHFLFECLSPAVIGWWSPHLCRALRSGSSQEESEHNRNDLSALSHRSQEDLRR